MNIAPRFLFANQKITFNYREALFSTNVIKKNDIKELETLNARYTCLLKESDASAELLKLGQHLFEWLDRFEVPLLELLSKGRSAPLLVEFEVEPTLFAQEKGEVTLEGSGEPLALSETATLRSPEKIWLEAPWELLANHERYLASSPLRFCPVRRLGSATQPLLPAESLLSLLFMAASPRPDAASDQELVSLTLAFEEEEAAILTSVDQLNLSLTVEESGNLSQLSQRLSQQMPDLLHLSCHGNNNPMCLSFEDAYGQEMKIGPVELKRALAADFPRLLFLSACKTAAPDSRMNTFNTIMVAQGVPAVLGWSGSVYDHDAVFFASVLYASLSKGKALEMAFADARGALIAKEQEELEWARRHGPVYENPRKSNWHFARLTLGPTGGGAFCSENPSFTKQPEAITHLEPDRVFLDKWRKRSPVAGPKTFVGRRRELQNALRHFQQAPTSLLLLHGLGRQGKSSLAFRIIQRLPEQRTVVIYGDKNAKGEPQERERFLQQSVLDAILAELPEAERKMFETEEKLSGVELDSHLVRILSMGSWLLVFDDFEQTLEPSGSSFLIQSEFRPFYLSLFRLVKNGLCPNLKVLITCRYLFALEELELRFEDEAPQWLVIHVPPMKVFESKKQIRAKRLAMGLAPTESDTHRRATELRAMHYAAGNPGLLELLSHFVREEPESAERVLREMETYKTSGQIPGGDELRAFMENLALDELLKLLDPYSYLLLQLSQRLSVPVPFQAFAGLAEQKNCDRLSALGLWDCHEDLCNPRQSAFAINPMVRPLVNELQPNLIQEKIAKLANQLEQSWLSLEGRISHPLAVVELMKLALESKNIRLLMTWGARALSNLFLSHQWKTAGEYAERIIHLCDEVQQEIPADLLLQACNALSESGYDPEMTIQITSRLRKGSMIAEANGEEVNWERLIEVYMLESRHYRRHGDLPKARKQLEIALSYAVKYHKKWYEAVVKGKMAEFDTLNGDRDAALKLYNEAIKFFESENQIDFRMISIYRSSIAKILVRQNRYEEAGKMLKNQILPVLKGLDFKRDYRVALVTYVDILVELGEYSESLLIIENELMPLFKEIGDVFNAAMMQSRMADIYYYKGDYQKALAIQQFQVLPAFEKLKYKREKNIAKVGIADVYIETGKFQKALNLLREDVLGEFQKLEDLEMVAKVYSNIARVYNIQGKYLETIQILDNEVLPIFQKLGDKKTHALFLAEKASCLTSCGELDEALLVLNDDLINIFHDLGDFRRKGLMIGKKAYIHFLRNDLDEALRIRLEEELPLYQQAKDAINSAVCYGEIAIIYLKKKKYNLAKQIILKYVLPYYNAYGMKSNKAQATFNLAMAYLGLHDVDVAKSIFNQCLEMYESMSMVIGKANALTQLGLIDLFYGEFNGEKYEMGLQSVITAFGLFKEQKHAAGIAMTAKVIGEVFCSGDFYNEGMNLLEISYENYSMLGQKHEAQAVLDLIRYFEK